MADWYSRYVTGPVGKLGSYFSTKAGNSKVVETIIKHEYQKLEPIGYRHLPCHSHAFLKLAAFSGLAAVVMSAYGSHIFNKKPETTKDLRDLYFNAQYYHLVHSVAMLSVPLVKRPKITGSFWVAGMVLFCGTMYYHALSNDARFRFLTPYGGFCLIAGWLSILV